MDRIPPLYRAALRSIKGPNMLLSGAELGRKTGLPAEYIKQSWWVRVVALE